MSTKRGERILGPYEQPNGWRIIEIAADGERKYSLFETEAKATRYKELLLAELAKGDHTTKTALEAYQKHLEAKGNKPDSVRQTVWAIGMFFPESLVLRTLTHRRCEALYDALRLQTKKDGSPRFSVDSHRGMLAQVRSFFAWCIERGWLTENPAAKVKGIGKRRPRGKSLGKEGNELGTDQARAWYDVAVFKASRGDKGAIAALVALLLGMRASEITTRKVSDVESDGALLWIPCSKTPAGRRRLKVPAVLREPLAACAKDRDGAAYLFPNEDGGAHWRDWIRKNVKRICALAKVPKVTAHAMRGLLATIAYEQGVVGDVVAAHLGHEEQKTSATSYAAPGAVDTGARARGQAMLDQRPN